MKNIEVIGLHNIINNVQENVSKGVINKEEIEPFNYAFIRNMLKFKPLIKDLNDIVHELTKNLNLESLSAEEQNKLVNEFLLNSEEYKSFLEEENNIILYTIPINKLEGTNFNFEVANLFLNTIIVDDEAS
jgi:hypothetical protein